MSHMFPLLTSVYVVVMLCQAMLGSCTCCWRGTPQAPSPPTAREPRPFTMEPRATTLWVAITQTHTLTHTHTHTHETYVNHICSTSSDLSDLWVTRGRPVSIWRDRFSFGLWCPQIGIKSCNCICLSLLLCGFAVPLKRAQFCMLTFVWLCVCVCVFLCIVCAWVSVCC